MAARPRIPSFCHPSVTRLECAITAVGISTNQKRTSLFPHTDHRSLPTEHSAPTSLLRQFQLQPLTAAQDDAGNLLAGEIAQEKVADEGALGHAGV